MPTAHEARVLNLIRKVDLTKASLKQWAIIRLLEWQPGAKRIRFAGKCHCRGKYLLSYQLDQWKDSLLPRVGWEECGYYCPSCGFSNAGDREVKAQP